MVEDKKNTFLIIGREKGFNKDVELVAGPFFGDENDTYKELYEQDHPECNFECIDEFLFRQLEPRAYRFGFDSNPFWYISTFISSLVYLGDDFISSEDKMSVFNQQLHVHFDTSTKTLLCNFGINTSGIIGAKVMDDLHKYLAGMGINIEVNTTFHYSPKAGQIYVRDRAVAASLIDQLVYLN